MGFKIAYRLAMIVLAVAIGSGLMARAAQSEPQHSQMAVSTVVAGDHLMTGARSGCAVNQHASAQFSCFATCASLGDLPLLASLLNTFDESILGPAADLVIGDHTIPPDPYPPKSYGLS